MRVHHVTADTAPVEPGQELVTDTCRKALNTVFPEAGEIRTKREACQAVVTETTLLFLQNPHLGNLLQGRIKGKGRTQLVINGEPTEYRWGPHGKGFQLFANDTLVDVPYTRFNICVVQGFYRQAQALGLRPKIGPSDD